MPEITFVLNDGTRRVIAAASGDNLMMVATDNGLPGIIGECGGSMMCGTCHCHIADEWAEAVPAAEFGELEMLDSVEGERVAHSRLSCQIRVTDALDGLVVRIPND